MDAKDRSASTRAHYLPRPAAVGGFSFSEPLLIFEDVHERPSSLRGSGLQVLKQPLQIGRIGLNYEDGAVLLGQCERS